VCPGFLAYYHSRSGHLFELRGPPPPTINLYGSTWLLLPLLSGSKASLSATRTKFLVASSVARLLEYGAGAHPSPGRKTRTSRGEGMKNIPSPAGSSRFPRLQRLARWRCGRSPRSSFALSRGVSRPSFGSHPRRWTEFPWFTGGPYLRDQTFFQFMDRPVSPTVSRFRDVVRRLQGRGSPYTGKLETLCCDG